MHQVHLHVQKLDPRPIRPSVFRQGRWFSQKCKPSQSVICSCMHWETINKKDYQWLSGSTNFHSRKYWS